MFVIVGVCWKPAATRILARSARAEEALDFARQGLSIGTLGSPTGFGSVHLGHIEALAASGAHDAARTAARAAAGELIARADKVCDPNLRRSMLENVAENARILALAEPAHDASRPA